MRLLPLGFAALLAAAVPASAQGPAEQAAANAALPEPAREAAAIVDAFHSALNCGDTASAAGLLADDAVIFEEGGAERTKAEYAAHHLPADAEFSRTVTSTVTRRAGSSNGTLAWIATEGRMGGNLNGKAVDRLTTETMLLRRVGQGWQIAHIHWSSAPAR